MFTTRKELSNVVLIHTIEYNMLINSWSDLSIQLEAIHISNHYVLHLKFIIHEKNHFAKQCLTDNIKLNLYNM